MSPVTERPRLLQTLPLQIADQLATSIVGGMFAPGSRLLEIDFAAQFGVSRATVREALRLLEQRGLVTILPQRGAHVTQLTEKELDDLFEVRASLLATGSRLAARHCDSIAAKQLQNQLAVLKACVDDLPSYANASATLVNMVMNLSRNAVLAMYISDFAQRTGRYVRLGLLTKVRRQASVLGWKKIVAAIVANDEEAASLGHRDLALANRAAAMAEFVTTKT